MFKDNFSTNLELNTTYLKAGWKIDMLLSIASAEI